MTLLTGTAIEGKVPKRFKFGHGLVGQCARKRTILVKNAGFGEYVRSIQSAGGTPVSIVVLPLLFEGDVKAAIELASFGQFSDVHLAFLDQLTQSIGIVLNTIMATSAPSSYGNRVRRWPKSYRVSNCNYRPPTKSYRKKLSCWPSRRRGRNQESGSGTGQEGAL